MMATWGSGECGPGSGSQAPDLGIQVGGSSGVSCRRRSSGSIHPKHSCKGGSGPPPCRPLLGGVGFRARARSRPLFGKNGRQGLILGGAPCIVL